MPFRLGSVNSNVVQMPTGLIDDAEHSIEGIIFAFMQGMVNFKPLL